MLTITEEIHLLVLDYDTGWPNPELPRHAIDTALGGALLMDLALNDRIDTDVGKLFVVNQDLGWATRSRLGTSADQCGG